MHEPSACPYMVHELVQGALGRAISFHLVRCSQVPAVFFWGEPLVPIFPRRDSRCLSYVAPPLVLPSIADPTAAQVDEWHAKYQAALQRLFDDSKAEVGEQTAQLEIF